MEKLQRILAGETESHVMPFLWVHGEPHERYREQIDAMLDKLSERERKVIVMRFGLEDGHPRTLEEVGREFGVTRERIRQIESKTLTRLRNPSNSSVLKDYIDS